MQSAADGVSRYGLAGPAVVLIDIDLYMVHVPLVPGWMAKDALEESWRRMELLYDRGVRPAINTHPSRLDLIRSIGVSNFSEEDLSRLMDHSSIIPHVNQCEMHPWYNPKELRLFCRENDIAFTVSSGHRADDRHGSGLLSYGQRKISGRGSPRRNWR